MPSKFYLIETLSSTHVGTGRGLGYIDLPVHREATTGWPMIPGSSMKGVLADHHGATDSARGEANSLKGKAFGKRPAEGGEGGLAGSLILTDARLVCLPMRSFKGTFAWCTSAMALGQLRRDLATIGIQGLPPNLPEVKDSKALVVTENCAITIQPPNLPPPPQNLPPPPQNLPNNPNHGGARRLGPPPGNATSKIVLDEYDFDAMPDSNAEEWAKFLAGKLYPNDTTWRDMFIQRLAVLPDTVFNQLCKVGLEVATRVRIDEETGIVADGQLWTEELLPPETILAGLVTCAGKEHAEILNQFAQQPAHLQIGGKASVGRGRARVLFGN